METSCQIHALNALPPGGKYISHQISRWSSRLRSKTSILRRKEKSLSQARGWTTNPPFSSPQPSQDIRKYEQYVHVSMQYWGSYGLQFTYVNL